MDVDVSSSDGFSHVYNSMNDSLAKTNPIVLIILTVIIIVYFFIFSYLGYTPGTPTSAGPKSLGLTIIEVIMWGLIIFLVLINGLQYFFQIDMKTAVKNLFLGTPEVDIQINPETQYEGEKKEKDGQKKNNSLVKELEKDLGLSNLEGNRDAGSLNNQVFNIPGNDYTYEDATALCKAYGGELATYSQIESAYKSGAEWCNYGWSNGQMAFFPTQKDTWNKLQKNPNTKQICGRPGVNGGYIKNPYVRFGANCYGIKPEKPDNWVATSYVTDCGKNKEDPNKKIRDGAVLNSFNTKKWSRY